MKEYYEKDRVSQSLLKALLKGIGSYKKERDIMFKKKKDHFLIGSAVDCKLTTPDEWDNMYYVADFKKPTEALSSVIHEVYDVQVNETERLGHNFRYNLEEFSEEILLSFKLHNLYPTYKDETKLKKAYKEGTQLYEHLQVANGRDILSSKELELVNLIVGSLTTHVHTSEYFMNNGGEEILYQLPIYFDYKGIECKALLDMVKVDHINKVLQPMDIKTIGSSTKLFPQQAERLRYDIQAAFYTLALGIYRDVKYKDYTILPFKFLVESTTSPTVLPLCFTCSHTTLAIGRYGAEITSNRIVYNGIRNAWKRYKVQGFENALDLYKWHKENDIWYIDKELYENKGQPDLQLFIK